MGKCDNNRPETKEGEKKVDVKAFKLEDIGDLPISLTIYPGCIEGDRVTYSVRGRDRAVLAFGTADQVARYSIGLEIDLSGKHVPDEFKGKYQRNINRKQAEAIARIQDEIAGTGEVAELAKTKGNARVNGYTLQINGEKVTPESILNSYFKEVTFVEGPDGKPVSKPVTEVTDKDKLVQMQGKDVRTMGGVELIVSAVIVPGNSNASRDYTAL